MSGNHFVCHTERKMISEFRFCIEIKNVCLISACLYSGLRMNSFHILMRLEKLMMVNVMMIPMSN